MLLLVRLLPVRLPQGMRNWVVARDVPHHCFPTGLTSQPAHLPSLPPSRSPQSTLLLCLCSPFSHTEIHATGTIGISCLFPMRTPCGGICWICRRSEWSVQGYHVTGKQGYQGSRKARHSFDQTSKNHQHQSRRCPPQIVRAFTCNTVDKWLLDFQQYFFSL